MTDEQIEKSLICCTIHDCINCPCYDWKQPMPECGGIARLALDYINRLKADKERLREDNKDFSAIVKAHKYCVGAEHCQNQDDIRQETAKAILCELLSTREFEPLYDLDTSGYVRLKHIYEIAEEYNVEVDE